MVARGVGRVCVCVCVCGGGGGAVFMFCPVVVVDGSHCYHLFRTRELVALLDFGLCTALPLGVIGHVPS